MPTPNLPLDGDDSKFLNQFKMRRLLLKNREIMAQRGGANQKIEVTDHCALTSQPAALATEDPGGFLILAEYLDTAKKRFMCSLYVVGRANKTRPPYTKT